MAIPDNLGAAVEKAVARHRHHLRPPAPEPVALTEAPPTSTDWSAETLRDILLRPRNAGIMVHKGEELCDAPWKPLVALETFRAVQRILTDPNRRTGPGAAPSWLGTTFVQVRHLH